MSNAATWQILDDDISLEEATDVLREDLQELAQTEIDEIYHQELWEEYFPRVTTQDFFDGFHDRMEALQGQRNTYYLGASLSFHCTNCVFDFAKDLVERKFPDINEDQVVFLIKLF